MHKAKTLHATGTKETSTRGSAGWLQPQEPCDHTTCISSAGVGKAPSYTSVVLGGRDGILEWVRILGGGWWQGPSLWDSLGSQAKIGLWPIPKNPETNFKVLTSITG